MGQCHIDIILVKLLEHHANGFEAQISIYIKLNKILIILLYSCLSVSWIWH